MAAGVQVYALANYAGSNSFFGYGPLAAGTWGRSNFAAYYGDIRVIDRVLGDLSP